MSFVLRFAVRSLRDRSVRSWLTISGVIVSIAVIFTLLTLSTSLQGAVIELFDQFGANRVQIAPRGGLGGGPTAVELLENDVQFVERLPYFDLVLPYLFEMAFPITYRGTTVRTEVIGIPTDRADETDRSYAFSDEIPVGRWFQQNERGSVILGYNVANNVNDRWFGREIPLRTNIQIGNESFRVIGVWREFGTPDDNQVFIPLEDARRIFDEPYKVSIISADVREGLDIDRVAEQTLRQLERRKGRDTVVILTPEQIIRQFNTIFGTVQGIFLGIASISLIVGALGIANTMFTSVLEREREIGIIKSVGARNSQVLGIFMAESGLIGLLGGIVGVVLGVLISLLIGAIAAASGFALLTIRFSIEHVILSLVFATIVGMLSGLFPSYIASRKRIVDTLRSA
ncbi:MAG: ABC transporter permease [Candidatus Woesearchaeota archaeon]